MNTTGGLRDVLSCHDSCLIFKLQLFWHSLSRLGVLVRRTCANLLIISDPPFLPLSSPPSAAWPKQYCTNFKRQTVLFRDKGMKSARLGSSGWGVGSSWTPGSEMQIWDSSKRMLQACSSKLNGLRGRMLVRGTFLGRCPCVFRGRPGNDMPSLAVDACLERSDYRLAEFTRDDGWVGGSGVNWKLPQEYLHDLHWGYLYQLMNSACWEEITLSR